ncbi:ABC transporter permease [Sporomusa acidovorans]|uniref:Dipeptide transport system permease protein DppB n=1 Tax=Sporomusa acidovorans (strain ATCC 49682 / DSM 3132 / Mol) TaxID=1123286 RepID=A0ABZ3IYA4_SPOA4|nr:ABC transporter permease [Sporomusa acidovorans]OZC22185.1 dipeptide transport system permease protein DppB [Sporomusa acidovorans DSM 3132]SDE81972.1 peptide/nickel transport system permease protein [Sporomusa acidovorans]
MVNTLYFQRSFRLLITFFLIITLNFALPRLMPGDPAITLLGQDAAVVTGADFAELRSKYGLDKQLWQQYLSYWQALSQGDLGYSYHCRQPVAQAIKQHLGWTLALLVPVVVFSSLLAILLGTIAGWKSGSKLDSTLTCGSLLFYSFPQFLIGMLLLKLFAFELRLFPLGGLGSGNNHSSFAYLLDTLWHLALPILALTIAATSSKLLLMRNSAAKERHEDYITYATAKGLSTCRILAVHLLRNACLPLLSQIALNIGFIVSGALVIEIVFSINGMGTLIYEAAIYRDYPLLQGCFLILTLFVVLANLLADLAYGIADPRISPSH